jgi:hypothetical protein
MIDGLEGERALAKAGDHRFAAGLEAATSFDRTLWPSELDGIGAAVLVAGSASGSLKKDARAPSVTIDSIEKLATCPHPNIGT